MAITLSDVEKLSHLARLKFSDQELHHFKTELSTIMDMIDTVQDLDCDGVEPLTSVTDMSQRMRKDEEIMNVDTNELFSNAPGADAKLAKEIKCFIVPKVVE